MRQDVEIDYARDTDQNLRGKQQSIKWERHQSTFHSSHWGLTHWEYMWKYKINNHVIDGCKSVKGLLIGDIFFGSRGAYVLSKRLALMQHKTLWSYFLYFDAVQQLANRFMEQFDR